MFVGNRLRAGEYAQIVPIGAWITLEYNENGNLLNVYNCIQGQHNILDTSIRKMMFDNSTVSKGITIRGSRTLVHGILTSESYSFTSSGNLPECIQSEVISKYESDPNKFTFYASNVESLSVPLSNIRSMSVWLKSCGFNVLPGFIVPSNFNELMFNNIVNRTLSLSENSLNRATCVGFLVFRNNQVEFENRGLFQIHCKSIENKLDETGLLIDNIYDDSNELITVNHYDTIRYDIYDDSIVLFDHNKQVINACNSGKHHKQHISNYTCSVCHKVTEINSKENCRCSDVHCMSNMYPRINQMISKLNLPHITFDRYITEVKSGNILSMSDIFELDIYKNIKIDVSISTLLKSLVPEDVCIDYSIFDKLSNRCNNSVQSVLYYLTHPVRMFSDLDIDPNDYVNLFKWLNDPINILDIESILQLDCFNILNSGCRFDGAPIFRNQTILITGRFIHGDSNTIIAILKSYSADVVEYWTENVTCLIIGDELDNINSKYVHQAREKGLPIYSESEFFKQFDIDADLIENLQ